MHSVADYENHARGKLGKAVEGYFYSGCFHEQTLNDNSVAFTRYRFRPRVLRDASKIDMRTTVLDQPISFPVGVAPVSMCGMAHPDGELGISKACERFQIPFCLSTVANVSMEEIASKSPQSTRWFQLYIYKERRLTEELVRRAEKAGFTALVLTVDAPVVGRRLSSLREPFVVPKHVRLYNLDEFVGDHQNNNTPHLDVIGKQLDQSITWNDVTWLMNLSKLPVILKGIITGEDAGEAVRRGVSGVWVSNHGGRQLDGVPATLDVLSEVVDAVDGRCEVYLDGGVRSGYDVIKAVALGARAVFIGRPALWGLVYKGAAGVESLLRLMKEETANAMALLGVNKLADLSRDHVIHETLLPKL